MMQIKGASERPVRAAKTLEEIKLKAQNSLNIIEVSSPALNNSASAQDTVKMLATPRNSIASVHNDDVDVDDLLAQGKAAADAAIDSKTASSVLHTPQAPQSEVAKPMKSIEYEKYTVDDIDEWLALTGFYDEGYRQKTLARHRRLKAIEEERQQLLREEKEDLQRHRVGLDPFSMVPGAPEPTLALEVAIKQDKSSFSPPPAQAVPPVASNDNRKRSLDEMKDEQSEQSTTPAKIARRRSLERFSIEPLKQTPPRGLAKQSGEHNPKQQESTDISHRFTRPDLFDSYTAPRRAQNGPDTRYFHIRSWNYDNVRAAQEDCTWVTQKANERTFTDAFEQSRRVILFFSVNNSKAFQGIAEMASIPGAAGLPNPPWRSKLHWPATEAFALIWLLKQDVPHHTVRHLSNPLNEGLPAHVGTDGVEIDTWVGEQMYSILTDYARRGHGRR